MKWINYHHLIYFREIAIRGSISEASKVLKVGQPALSTQLKQFEEYMGVELFERRNRRLILTEAGKVTLDYAEKVSELGQELIQVIEQKSFTKRINLNVGAQDAIPKHVVSSILDFAHKKTGCYLSILEGPPSYLYRELENHRLDLLITDQNVLGPDNRNVFSKLLIKSNVGAYASEKFLKLKQNFPKSLEGAPVILPTSHSKLRSDLEHYFYLQNIHLDKVAESQDSMLQKILATKGDGVVFLSDIAVKELVQEKKLYCLGTLKNIYIEYYLVYSKKLIGNEAVDILIKQKFVKADF